MIRGVHDTGGKGVKAPFTQVVSVAPAHASRGPRAHKIQNRWPCMIYFCLGYFWVGLVVLHWEKIVSPSDRLAN